MASLHQPDTLPWLLGCIVLCAGVLAPVAYYYIKAVGSGSASTYGRRD